MMSRFVIVFTDLDGTLLDHRTYDHRPALPALTEMKRREIPLILCTSKSAAEVLDLRTRLKTSGPFIVENGGGIYVPKSYFRRLQVETIERGNFILIRIGKPYDQLIKALADGSGKAGATVRSFADMTPAELAREAGLTIRQASLALKREFDLPFIVENGGDFEDLLEAELRAKGLSLIKGGRYWHLTGNGDKGKAARLLSELYRDEHPQGIISVGLGDSLNDLDLLQVVDVPVVIPNPESRSRLGKHLPQARRAAKPGPAGWNEVVLELLSELA